MTGNSHITRAAPYLQTADPAEKALCRSRRTTESTWDRAEEPDMAAEAAVEAAPPKARTAAITSGPETADLAARAAVEAMALPAWCWSIIEEVTWHIPQKLWSTAS